MVKAPYRNTSVQKIITSMLITPVYLILLFFAMTGFQYIYARRNELDKQKTYIDENIKEQILNNENIQKLNQREPVYIVNNKDSRKKEWIKK